MRFTDLELAFWAAFMFVAYAYLGYAVLLALLVQLRPAPAVRKGQELPSLSLVIVAHNEEAGLAAKLDNCLSLDYPADWLQILVVSDGSTDRTEDIATQFASRGVHLLVVPPPARGKPVGLNLASQAARGDLLVLCDTRQRLERGALRALAANFSDPSVGVVSGELMLEPGSSGAAGQGLGLYWRYENLIRRLESRLDSTVGATGAFYAIRLELFAPLDPRTILDDVSLPMGAVLADRRVVFEPEARAFDRTSNDAGHEFRRKVRTLAGNFQLVGLRPELLNPFRNRLFWQFVSHKLSRLLVPWCLLVMLGTDLALALSGPPLYVVLLVAQALFYVLAAAGALQVRFRLHLRVLSLPYAFVLLNLAAMTSAVTFLRGNLRAAWKQAET